MFFPEEDEAGVVERGYGMEERGQKRAVGRVDEPEADRQDDERHHLRSRGEGYDADSQPDHRAVPPDEQVSAETLLEEDALRQRDSLSQRDEADGGERHEPKPSDEYDRGYDQLSPDSPVGGGVSNYQAGDGGGGRCGEQRVHERGEAISVVRERE